MLYLVIEPHRSEFPEPISFVKHTPLAVGERYEGDEGWDNWYFCDVPGQQGGWVPGQVIRILAAGQGVALEDYTARELDVDSGQRVFGARQMNGWVWCSYVEPEGLIAGNAGSHKVGTELKSGWVPLRNLQPA
ncbi:SH3 domain-containing protein [Pseudomonas putida]|uniref:SH3 domain-containing protein n=1 Tax=Pseudomonas putida TaxID=303 RepID=A0A1Q9R4Q4_PSEPU|nr:SH3 domain-containing protein [Pseudomonas putida]OLS62348.1 hypothetical protein PSEMO_28120 [Pseudomonas putida]